MIAQLVLSIRTLQLSALDHLSPWLHVYCKEVWVCYIRQEPNYMHTTIQIGPKWYRCLYYFEKFLLHRSVWETFYHESYHPVKKARQAIIGIVNCVATSKLTYRNNIKWQCCSWKTFSMHDNWEVIKLFCGIVLSKSQVYNLIVLVLILNLTKSRDSTLNQQSD